LIRNEIKRVVYACEDPNPKASGGGEKLRAHGIVVEQGLLRHEAEAVNHQFMFAMRRKRPLVVVKAACSLDGRIALPTGESKWITGEESRKEGHRLRADLGAVLVGRRTVEVDDPELTARIVGVTNQPLRIVLDPSKKLSGHEKVFNEHAETQWVTGEIELPQLLVDLFKRGTTGVLVEGGAKTIAAFVQAGLVDRFELFVAPRLLGDGPTWLEGLSLQSLTDAPKLKIVQTQRVGDDFHLTAEPI
jgi:diaminohydroxyphosphoribosylaminopyrimidine deaminase/5-amino-6-(5-phosphoribosylamino)uracil reductase